MSLRSRLMTSERDRLRRENERLRVSLETLQNLVDDYRREERDEWLDVREPTTASSAR